MTNSPQESTNPGAPISPHTETQQPQSDVTFSSAHTEDVETLSYEQAREQLVAIVSALEAGGTPLEQSLALWQRGEALADRCERWLNGAQAKLDEVRENLNAPESGA